MQLKRNPPPCRLLSPRTATTRHQQPLARLVGLPHGPDPLILLCSEMAISHPFLPPYTSATTPTIRSGLRPSNLVILRKRKQPEEKSVILASPGLAATQAQSVSVTRLSASPPAVEDEASALSSQPSLLLLSWTRHRSPCRSRFCPFALPPSPRPPRGPLAPGSQPSIYGHAV